MNNEKWLYVSLVNIMFIDFVGFSIDVFKLTTLVFWFKYLVSLHLL